jgi:hypothetical protein
MKLHRAWWIVAGLLLLAWAPFGVYELVQKIRGFSGYPDEQVAIQFGFWLFVWWPCHIIVALIVLYKLIQWILTLRREG